VIGKCWSLQAVTPEGDFGEKSVYGAVKQLVDEAAGTSECWFDFCVLRAGRVDRLIERV